MARPEKVAMVEEIQERLSRMQGAVLTDYRGLTAGEMSALRKELRDAGVEYKVFKNTLSILAAEGANLDGLTQYLTGPTAFAFGYNDPVTPARIISEFAKKYKALEIKGGVVEGQVVGPESVVDLANLPSREVLLSMVLRGMQGPMTGMVNVLQGNIRNFVYALNAVKEQKEASA